MYHHPAPDVASCLKYPVDLCNSFWSNLWLPKLYFLLLHNIFIFIGQVTVCQFHTFPWLPFISLISFLIVIPRLSSFYKLTKGYPVACKSDVICCKWWELVRPWWCKWRIVCLPLPLSMHHSSHKPLQIQPYILIAMLLYYLSIES